MPLPQRKPFPIDLRTWSHSTDLNLLGQDQFFSGAGCGPDYDFPNPRGKVFSNELRTFTCGLMLGLIASALPNIQQHSPPNPNGKVFPSDLRTFINPCETQLIGQDLFFGAAGECQARDFPNPIGKKFPSDLRTFTNPAEVQLIGQDLFFSVAGIGPNYDFPNPQLKKSSFASLCPIPINNIVFSIVVYPSTFVFDFPNPIGKQYPQDLRTFLNLVDLNLLGKDQFFAAAGMGPQYDFPNPKGKSFASDLRIFNNASEIQLIGQDKFFGAAGEPPRYDFPNPQLRKFSLGHVSQLAGNLLGTTLVGGFVPNPYYVLLLNDNSGQI